MPLTVHTNIHDEFVYMSITFMQDIYSNLETILQIQKCPNLNVDQDGGPGAQPPGKFQAKYDKKYETNMITVDKLLEKL